MTWLPKGKVVSVEKVAVGPLPLLLTGVTWNVYWVLGIRPEALNNLISVPFTDLVVLVEAEVGLKVTSYPVISLLRVKQGTLSHWIVTELGNEEAIKFTTVPLGAERRNRMLSEVKYLCV